jgi:hypothetical protein
VNSAIFEQKIRHPIYFIIGGVLLLISIILFASALRSSFTFAFESNLLAAVSILFAMMFVFWSIVGRKVKFYEREIKFDQFMKLPRFDHLSYSDIARIDDFASNNVQHKKLLGTHHYFVLHMKNGVKPNRIVLTNIKNDSLDLDLETFLRSRLNKEE